MRIHHLAFRTHDLARLVAFYVDVLGFTVTKETDRSAWLDAGGTILMLERADDGEAAIPYGSKELVAFAISPGEAATFVHRVAVEARTGSTVYFRDPDGRRIALSAYPETLP